MEHPGTLRIAVVAHAGSCSNDIDLMRRTRKSVMSKNYAAAIMLAVAGLFCVPEYSLAQNVRYADLASRTFAAAQTAKQQCTNACRARYRDCRHVNQLPSSECLSVYQDCTRYACAGSGPG